MNSLQNRQKKQEETADDTGNMMFWLNGAD
jgi:hypothetical protein